MACARAGGDASRVGPFRRGRAEAVAREAAAQWTPPRPRVAARRSSRPAAPPPAWPQRAAPWRRSRRHRHCICGRRRMRRSMVRPRYRRVPPRRRWHGLAPRHGGGRPRVHEAPLEPPHGCLPRSAACWRLPSPEPAGPGPGTRRAGAGRANASRDFNRKPMSPFTMHQAAPLMAAVTPSRWRQTQNLTAPGRRGVSASDQCLALTIHPRTTWMKEIE
jgi:hypothetical protein